MATFQRILVPVDGSDASSRALAKALELSRESGARLRLLTVLDDLEFLAGYEYAAPALEQARRSLSRMLEQWAGECEAAGVPCESRLVEEHGVRLGDSIAAQAREWNADLVVVGSHGRKGLGRVLLGSGAEQIVRAAEVPVLVVRPRTPVH